MFFQGYNEGVPFLQTLLLTIVRAAAILAVIMIAGIYFWNKYQYKDYYVFENPNCNIAVIPIESGITTVPDDTYFTVAADRVLADIRWAEKDPMIEGILVRIDSPGGYIVSSEVITDALRRAQKPVAALIRDYGTSGAYLVATGADTIIASPNSTVGSIGITQSYVETVAKTKKDGGQFIELVSAPFKEIMNPDRLLSDDEKKMVLNDLTAAHKDFVAQIARNRSLQVSQIETLADGRTFLGRRALDLKLIDALGDQETARAWFKERATNEPDFCEPPPPAPLPAPQPSA